MLKDKVIKAIQDIIKKMPEESSDRGMMSVVELAEYWKSTADAYEKKYDLFKSILSNLTDSEVQEVVSVMHLGRGDFDTFDSAFKHNMYQVSNRDDALLYMLGKTPLKNYLRHGLKRMAIAG